MTNEELDLRFLGKENPNYKKWKRQRIRKGFSDRDLWNMDAWLCNIIPDALDRHVKRKEGDCPEGWGSSEEYILYIKNIAADIRKAYALNNVSIEENHWPTVEQVKINKMESERLMKSAFARLASVIWNLWD